MVADLPCPGWPTRDCAVEVADPVVVPEVSREGGRVIRPAGSGIQPDLSRGQALRRRGGRGEPLVLSAAVEGAGAGAGAGADRPDGLDHSEGGVGVRQAGEYHVTARRRRRQPGGGRG